MFPATHLSISINRSPKDIYEFASNPRNIPEWATGLSETEVVPVGDHWECEGPMGKIKFKFAEKNNLGVMDHDVEVAGERFHNPFRVLENDKGGEVVFTLYRRPGMSDKEFAQDKANIEKDLATLKKLLE